MWDLFYAGQVTEMTELVQAVDGYWEAVGISVRIRPIISVQAYSICPQRMNHGPVCG